MARELGVKLGKPADQLVLVTRQEAARAKELEAIGHRSAKARLQVAKIHDLAVDGGFCRRIGKRWVE